MATAVILNLKSNSTSETPGVPLTSTTTTTPPPPPLPSQQQQQTAHKNNTITDIEASSLFEEKLKSIKLEFLSQKTELESTIDSLTKTLGDEQQQRHQLESKLSQLTEKLQETERSASAAQQALQSALRNADAATATAKELESLLKKSQQESQGNQQELVQGRKERESLKFKVIDAERRAVDAESAATTARRERDDIVARLQSLQTEFDRAHSKRNALETQLHARDDQLEASYQDQNELLRRLEAAIEDAQAAKSLVQQERDRNQTIEAARGAAVEDARKLLAERRDLSLSLETIREEIDTLKKDLSEERMNRIAAEKALDSHEAQIDHLVAELSAAQEESAALVEERKEDRARFLTMEQDAQLAAKDAKDALHREMEALAEAEKHAETVDAMRQELTSARKETAAAIAAAEAAEKRLAVYGEGGRAEEEPAKKRRGRPKKSESDDAESSTSSSSAAGAAGMVVDVGNVLDEAEMSRRITIAEAAAEEAQQRAYEIRAEAALLVETVEDRAVEAVEAAQAEVKRLKAELKRVSDGNL